MKVDIPECKRCCCCLPLRYGLLTLGYFKIIANATFIPFLLYYLVITILLLLWFVGIEKARQMESVVMHLSLCIATLTVLVLDFVATIVFIIAGHKKNVKLLRVFYFYSIAYLIVMLLLATSSACLFAVYWISYDATLRSWDSMLVIYSTYFVVLALQIYFLLLLRSETNKLRKNCEFRFVNNAAEAECTMKCEEVGVGEETENVVREETEIVVGEETETVVSLETKIEDV